MPHSLKESPWGLPRPLLYPEWFKVEEKMMRDKPGQMGSATKDGGDNGTKRQDKNLGEEAQSLSLLLD